jgi:hypothetical protein
MEVVNVVFAAAWIADEGLGGARRGQRGAVEVSRQKEAADPPRGPVGLTKVAGAPVSIFARSKAKGCGPRKLVPAELKTFMLM